MAAATGAALAAEAVAALAFFCLCLNVGLCQTIAPVLAATNSSSSPKVVRLELVPRDSPQAATSNRSEASFLHGLTGSDRVLRAIHRSHRRAAAINRGVQAQDKADALPGGYHPPVSPGDGEFLLKMTVGTPAMGSFQAILDTASDLTWMQCQPCENCYQQPTPIFDPSDSQTYQACAYNSDECRMLSPDKSSADSKNMCRYRYTYGDGSWSQGTLATDDFTLALAPFSNVVFGCGHDNAGKILYQGAGMVGFGRGALSLPAQFANSVGSDGVAFAYCLFSGTTGSSPLWLGPDASTMIPDGTTSATTPLVINPVTKTGYYYVSLIGIEIAGIAVGFPPGTFDIKHDGTGGLIFDTGSTLTYLEPKTYETIIMLIKSYVQLKPVDSSSVGIELCYDASQVLSYNLVFPTIVLTFAGGAKMPLPPFNYILVTKQMACVGLAAADGVSIIGNAAQLNYFVLLDTTTNLLSFARTQCNGI